MEKFAIVFFIVLVGCYSAGLIYLNSKVRLDAEGRGFVDEDDNQQRHQVYPVLKDVVSAGGFGILGLFVLMVLLALLLGYSFFFDPQFLE